MRTNRGRCNNIRAEKKTDVLHVVYAHSPITFKTINIVADKTKNPAVAFQLEMVVQ